MEEPEIHAILDELRSQPREGEWFEFKTNNSNPDEIGQYISALANGATLNEKPYAYLVWGIEDQTNAPVGTKFQPAREKIQAQALEMWLVQHLAPRPEFRFQELVYKGQRIVLLTIRAVTHMPVRWKNFAYIRLGAMRWADIDFKGKTWTIPGEKMKNNQSLTLALSEAELDLLKARRKKPPGEWVFPGDGRTGHYVEPKRAWARLLKRAKIEDLHVHDLRRSLASFMANSGADVSLIRSALNHKDIKTTLNVYVRTARSAELSAREKAHELMNELAKATESEEPAVAGKQKRTK